MKEANTVHESISRIEYYEITRSQIEHEDNLINQRPAGTLLPRRFSFLHTRYSSMPRRRYAYKGSLHNKKYFFSLIPLVAIGASILTYITIIAAILATANLRRLLKTHMKEGGERLIASSSGIQTNFTARAGSPILMPFLFMISWIVLLIKS